MDKAHTSIEIWDTMREGQNGFVSNPATGGLPGAHLQAYEFPDGLPKSVGEAPHGSTPPIRGGMLGLQHKGLQGEATPEAAKRPGEDLGTHPHPGGYA